MATYRLPNRKKREVQIMQYLRFYDKWNYDTEICFTNKLTDKELKRYMYIKKYKSFILLDEENFDIKDGYIINNEIGFLETIKPSFEGEPDYYSIQFCDTIFQTVETYVTFKDLLQIKDFYEQNILNGNDKFFLNNNFSIVPQKFGEQYDVMEY
jgi:hypothetical protein